MFRARITGICRASIFLLAVFVTLWCQNWVNQDAWPQKTRDSVKKMQMHHLFSLYSYHNVSTNYVDVKDNTYFFATKRDTSLNISTAPQQNISDVRNNWSPTISYDNGTLHTAGYKKYNADIFGNISKHDSLSRRKLRQEPRKLGKFRSLTSCDKCFVSNYEYLNLPKNVCMFNSSDGRPLLDMVITVLSIPNNFSMRNVLRDTWVSTTRGNTSPSVRHVFLLGAPLDKQTQPLIDAEAKTHNDIVQMSFVDSYQNLTLKTMMMLEWATTVCYNARYIYKVDEDVFSNIMALINITKQYAENTSILGERRSQKHPNRSPVGRNGKWFVNFTEYPRSDYPPFPAGPRYLVPMTIASTLLNVSLNTPILRLEDVYMGLLLEKTPYTVTNVQSMIGKGTLPTHCTAVMGLTTLHIDSGLQALSEIWHRCFKNFK